MGGSGAGAGIASLAAAIVDVDGTLLDGSSERLFLLHLLSCRTLRPPALLRFAARWLVHPAATLAHGPGWNRSWNRNLVCL